MFVKPTLVLPAIHCVYTLIDGCNVATATAKVSVVLQLYAAACRCVSRGLYNCDCCAQSDLLVLLYTVAYCDVIFVIGGINFFRIHVVLNSFVIRTVCTLHVIGHVSGLRVLPF